jgi:hypothetical protein
MAKTLKDKKPIYGGPTRFSKFAGEKLYSRRFANFRRFGPVEPDAGNCPYCGGFVEYDSGYLVCHECGATETILSDFFLTKAIA